MWILMHTPSWIKVLPTRLINWIPPSLSQSHIKIEMRLCPSQHRLRLDKTQKKKHQHWHIFLRVFDYQAVSLSQETEKLTEEDTSLNSKKKLDKMMKQKFGLS